MARVEFNGGGSAAGTLVLAGSVNITSTLTKVADLTGNLSPLQISTLDVTNYGLNGDVDSTAFGRSALDSTTSGVTNTAFGRNALTATNTGFGNVAMGSYALAANTSGQDNVAIGTYAMRFTTSSGRNIAIGTSSLASLTTGTQNIGVGYSSGAVITTGSLNHFFGYRAGTNVTTGDYNHAFGHSALFACSTGQENCAFGFETLLNATSNNNSGFGMESLRNTSSGFGNVAIGKRSGYSNTIGSGNTLLGTATDTGDFSNSVIIGRGALAVADNQFVVGSVLYNAGSVTTESNSSTRVWNVIINGVARKILLA
jgi:hypothetical protein